MKARYFVFTVLLLAACQQIEVENTTPVTKDSDKPAAGVYTLTVQAAKSDAVTKALDLTNNGATLNAYWKSTEKVTVYKDGTRLGELDVTPGSGEKPLDATLSGSITVDGLAQGDNLTLIIPRDIWDYSGQTGTLASIETDYDYATATVAVNTISGQSVTTAPATFNNMQSIYRFGFKIGDDCFDPKDFTISASSGMLVQGVSYSGGIWTSAFGNVTVTPASAASDHFYYVSLRNDATAGDSYNFVITGPDDALYVSSKDIPSDLLSIPGKFISAKNISATKPDFSPGSKAISDSNNVL